MSLADLSSVLWRERELLEMLLFKLDVQQLLLAAGRTEWVPRASREVEAVLEKLGETELNRSLQVEIVAMELGLSPNPSLRMLASSAPEPWGQLMRDHHRAFLDLAARIEAVSDANRDLVMSAKKATDAVLASLDSGEPALATYVPTGQRAPLQRKAALLDEEI